MSKDGMTRRTALQGVAVTGVAVPLLAGCADEDPRPMPGRQDDDLQPSGERLASTSEVAVGAAVVFADREVVVTQPSEGEFRCFSAICTHEGCTVSSSDEGQIPCRCHFSMFSLEDGSVLDGPAEQPLPEVEIVVEGDEISFA